MKIFTLVVILMITLPNFSQAVVGGIDLDSNETPILRLSFEAQGFDPNPCSGSYLGNGWALTAAHCFLLNEYQVAPIKVCLQNPKINDKACVPIDQVEVKMLPNASRGYQAPTAFTHRVIWIPLQDIAIFKFKDSNEILKDVPAVDLIQESLTTESQQFNVVGQGCDSYTIPIGGRPTGVGILRMATVEGLIVNSESTWISLWTPFNQNGGVCWGDSGGALLKQNTQVGVISAIKPRYDYKGNVTQVMSIFTRLDNTQIYEWINGVVIPNLLHFSKMPYGHRVTVSP